MIPQAGRLNRLAGKTKTVANESWVGLAGARIAQATFSAGGAIVTIRLLGPLERGRYATALAVVGVTAHFVQLGLPAGITRDLGRGAAVPALPRLAGAMAVFAALSTLLVAAVFLDSRTDYLVAAGYASAMVLASTANAYALGRQSYRLLNAVALTTGVLIPSTGITLAAITGSGILVMLGNGVALSLVALVQLAALRDESNHRAILPWLRETRRFSTLAWLTHGFQEINVRGDILAVAIVRGTEAAGIYSAATALAQIVLVPGHALGEWAFSRGDRTDGLQKDVRSPVRAIVLAGLPMLFLVAVLSPGIPRILGEEFRPSVLPFLLMLPGTYCLIVFLMYSKALAAQGRADMMLGFTLVGTVTLVVCNALLLRPWAEAGAGLSRSLAYVATTAVAVWGTHRYWRRSEMRPDSSASA